MNQPLRPVMIYTLGILIISVLVPTATAESVPESRMCEDPAYIKRRFNAMFPDAMVGHTVGPFQIGKDISYLYPGTAPSSAKNATRLKASICPLAKCEHHERYAEIYGLYGDLPPAHDKLKDVARQVNVTFDPASCADYCSHLDASYRRHSEMLVVVTTSNQFEMTSKLLQSLNSVTDLFDLLFVDDYSVDGTPEYLIKKGYAVIRNAEPKGLTYSWNVGYRMARLLNYTYVTLCNNDILIPNGAIAAMSEVLRDNVSVVVPLSSEKGAGHNPSQSFRIAHELPLHMESYIDNPYNTNKLQQSLCKKARNLSAAEKSAPSQWNQRLKFNGFMFALNLNMVPPCEHDSRHLFDPSNVMVGQEDSLMKCLIKRSTLPRIAMYAFVYHFKSVTVKAANYTAGDKNETRNDLSFYHPSRPLSTRKHSSIDIFRRMLEQSHGRPHGREVFPPLAPAPVDFCIATSNSVSNPSAGDIMTARELAESLRQRGDIEVRFLDQGPQWYAVEECDVLLIMLPSYDVSKITKERVNLLKIVWMRNWFHLFYQVPSFGAIDLVLASSAVATTYFAGADDFAVRCSHRCPGIIQELIPRRSPVKVDTLLLATNPSLFYSPTNETSQPTSLGQNRTIDYLFSGNYWNCHRQIMELDPSSLRGYVGHVYGKGWERSPVSGTWRHILRGRALYGSLPSLYRSASILIDDANHVTKPWGSVNSRVYDGLAGGALVITNGELGSNCSFGGLIPTYRTVTELEKKLKYFLNNDKDRERTVRSLQALIIEKHTYANRADTMIDLLSEFGVRVHPTAVSPATLKAQPGICIGIRVFEDQVDMIEPSIGNLMAQYKHSLLRPNISLRIYLVNTDIASQQFDENLKTKVVKLNADFDGPPVVSIVTGQSTPRRVEKNVFYGYDDTDMLLDHMLEDSVCSHVMLTNGDNMYNKAWFDAVSPLTMDPTLHLIGWNFVTHHKRNNLSQQVIETELVRQKVDLGSVLVSRRAYLASGASFLPEAAFTGDMFARDFFAISRIKQYISPWNIRILPQVLLFHQ